MHYLDQITSALDEHMDNLGVKSLTAPIGIQHLISIGLLRGFDMSGTEMRKLCSNGLIRTARQPAGKGTRWIIYHSKNKTLSISSKLQKIIDAGKGEREICAFLAKYPEILRWAVCRTGGHGAWVIKEFPLGSKYKVDFAVITCYSGKWEIHLLELEPHDDQVVTKKGAPSARLSGAITQINEWREYIKQNPVAFRQDLSDWCMKKDILGANKSINIPINGTGQYLKSPDTYLDIDFYIVIGNRRIVNNEQRVRINQIQQAGHDLEIFTYGRFVDIAKNHDDYHHGVENTMMTNTQDRE